MSWVFAVSPVFNAVVVAAMLVAAPQARAADEVKPSTAIQFSYERAIDAVAAPFVLAASKGLFRAENLAVASNNANGSPDAIARVASGASDLAIADLNALIRYRDGVEAVPVKAVFVLMNAAPYAIIARKSRGVRGLGDLEGKSLGVADGDLAIRLWPALAKRNGIKLSSVRQEKISATVREPMLSAGQVDAISGLSFLSPINLRDRGIPADDLAVLRFADYGSAAYGLAIIVNPKFAAAKPEAVAAFLRAVTVGLRMAIKDPAGVIDKVLTQMEDGSRETELARLRTALNDNIVTPDVRRDGLGGIDASRFAAAIDEIAVDFKFRQRPAIADIFDGGYLPTEAQRRID